MTALDQKVNAAFAGRVVRKDLVRKVKVGANVPVFVLEYLLGKYCATDDPIAIDAGLPRYSGSLNKKTPAMLVGFLSQSLPSFKNCDNLSSPDIYVINNYFIHYPFNFIYLHINWNNIPKAFNI